jgi:flagellar biosynthesis/type III secretory pathway chaperone
LTTLDTNPQTQNHFLRILHQETAQAKQLLDLLEQEFHLLKANPGEALQSLLVEKRAQLTKVEQCVTAHHHFLQLQGLSPDRRGTEAYLDQCGEKSSLSAAWTAYLEMAQACKRQNDINGGAVTLNQRQVNQALALLLGLGEGNKTYGPSGESRPVRPSKTLGKA